MVPKLESAYRQGFILLRKGLDIFCNGEGVSRKALVFLRGGGPRTIVNSKRWCDEVHVFSATVPTHYGQPLADVLEQVIKCRFSLRKMAEAITALFRVTSTLANDQASTPEKDLRISGTLGVSRFDRWRQQVLSKFTVSASCLSPFSSGYFFTGSVADGRIAYNYSDVDTVMIVRNEVLKQPEELMTLRKYTVDLLRYFYAIDPLQHHGHFLVSELELSYYDQHFLPLSLWHEVVPILNIRKLALCERTDPDSRLMVLKSMACTSQKWCRDGLPHEDLYQLKAAVSLVQLFPAVYLQSLGDFVTKRDSFEKARGHFPEQLWDPILRATALRAQWPRLPRLFLLLRPLFFRMPSPWSLYYLGRVLYRKVPGFLLNILGPDFPKRFKRLVETTIARV